MDEGARPGVASSPAGAAEKTEPTKKRGFAAWTSLPGMQSIRHYDGSSRPNQAVRQDVSSPFMDQGAVEYAEARA
jgi:hypothetical protein